MGQNKHCPPFVYEVVEPTRTTGAWVWLERSWHDVRYGVRLLAATPGFTSIAVLSLAIGIGANCAIFSFADALLLRPLPVARPGDVFTVGSNSSVEAFGINSLVSSYRDYVDIRDRATSLDGLVAFRYVTAGAATAPNATPRLRTGVMASANLFAVMGVEPTIGRSFRLEEGQVPGRDAVVVLGRTMWEQEFGSDPGVLGTTLRLNGHPFTVIGVAPPGFTGLHPLLRSDFFVPVMMAPRLINDPQGRSLEARDARNLTLKGRLKPGVSQASAQSELTAIAADLERSYPDTNRNRRFMIRTELQSRIAEDPPDSMLTAMLATLALAVLLVACANVAGLLTSRAPARARELALRLALGAGRGQVVRQLITESLLIALAGGVFGLAVGYAGMTLFRQIEIPTDLPIALTFQLDRRALLFSLVVAMGSAVLFGLVPAIQATRTDLTAIMKAADSVAPGRRGRRWGRSVLVAAQVAISVVLLSVAMFMYRGFGAQLAAGPGYRTDHLLMMRFDTTLIRYTEGQSQQFFEQVAERARAVPGVKSVTLSTAVPMLNDSNDAVTIVPEGFQFAPGRDNATVMAASVDEYYFDTMALTILEGRNFRIDDSAGAPRVAIVNQQFAQHYWPNEDPINKRFRLVGADNAWVQVVGLAKTSKYIFIAEPPMEFVYLPYWQQKPQRMTMLAQSAGDPSTLAGPMREIVRGLDATLPISGVRTMEAVYEMRAVRIFRVLITVIGGMGLMGLGLAIVGLYGLVAFAVGRRTREIGIRMAIGADRAAVVHMVLRQGLVLALAGLTVGVAASVGAGQLLQAAFPSGEDQGDIVALLLVVAIVLAVTALAAYIPARQASRVDPILALRHE